MTQVVTNPTPPTTIPPAETVTVRAWVTDHYHTDAVLTVQLPAALFEGRQHWGYVLGDDVDVLLPAPLAAAIYRILDKVRADYPQGSSANYPTHPTATVGGWISHFTTSSLTWRQLYEEILMTSYITDGPDGDVIVGGRNLDRDLEWVWTVTITWDRDELPAAPR